MVLPTPNVPYIKILSGTIPNMASFKKVEYWIITPSLWSTSCREQGWWPFLKISVFLNTVGFAHNFGNISSTTIVTPEILPY